MIDLRPFDALGRSHHGWLKAAHHFSIGSYYDPARLGWGALRVWNDDEFAPGSGFPLHPHADIEIITYVRSGAITHEDTIGSRGTTVAGDVQVMSAGTGIRHSEFNLEQEPTSIFQIWILPDQRGGTPRWGTKPFPKQDRAGRLITLASGFEADVEALPIAASARVMGGTLSAEEIRLQVDPMRHIYLVALEGSVAVNGVRAQARDGVAITDETELAISGDAGTEIVLVDAT